MINLLIYLFKSIRFSTQ